VISTEKIREKIRLHKKKIFNNYFLRWFFIFSFYVYVRFIFATSRIRLDESANGLADIFEKNKTLIFSSWHQDIILSNFAAKIIRKKHKLYQFNALASKHNDGQIVSDFISLFNKTNVIYGSTQSKGREDRGIDMSSFRNIFKTLKKPSQCFFITPDGPRGPAKKIKGHVCDIAILSKTPIVAISCKVNNKMVLNSWDRFVIPLPFSKIEICLSSPVFFDKKYSNNISILQKIMS
jgi:lysophospholipid acyltransferase (LPLAT)-like uncharacterized protein